MMRWDDPRLDLMDTRNWRIAFSVLGMEITAETYTCGILHQVGPFTAGTIALFGWMFMVFAIMGRENALHARQIRRDWEDVDEA